MRRKATIDCMSKDMHIASRPATRLHARGVRSWPSNARPSLREPSLTQLSYRGVTYAILFRFGLQLNPIESFTNGNKKPRLFAGFKKSNTD